MVKKTYNKPSCLIVELGIRRAAMLTASVEAGGSGTQILTNGGTGTGDDIGVKGTSDVNLWDKEW